MKKIALFNHKGGVGRTTLTVNIADALARAGKTVLVVDADPQCSITSFYLEEPDLERLLRRSDKDGARATLWSAVKPVIESRGGIASVWEWQVGSRPIYLLPGDIMLSEYEVELAGEWDKFIAGRQRTYQITTALSRVVDESAKRLQADIVLYDVGPNIGPLNRVVLLDCDHFITPVGADLFSLRALTTAGRLVAKWATEWRTIRRRASPADRTLLLSGMPNYLGYITCAYKIYAGGPTQPHTTWEGQIAHRVRDRVIRELKAVDSKLLPQGSNKLGGIKHYQSVATSA